MKTIYFLIITAAYLLLPVNMSAQTERNLVLHLNDNTTQKFAVSSIDSISFESENPEEKAPFNVELVNISELYAEFRLTPDDPTMTYNMMCEPKSEIDKYPNDDAIFADDKLFYQELAEGYGMTLSELLGYFLITDEFWDFHTGLLPNTDYVMYMYGMSTEGEKTTPMMKVYFKTKDVQHINNKIAIDAEMKDNCIEVTYTPDDDNLHYTAGLFNAMDVPDFSQIGTQLQQSISNIITDYVLGETPLSEYLEGYTSKGKSTGRFEGADPDGIYYIVAAYLDDECGVCSEVTVKTVGEEPITKKISRNRLMRFKKAANAYRMMKK